MFMFNHFHKLVDIMFLLFYYIFFYIVLMVKIFSFNLKEFEIFILKAVRQLGSDFVCNFIQSMDGERDPRNLVLCFQCLQYMTKYLDIGKIRNND